MNEDILLKHWELYCELEKNLGLQASIYTKEQFYKEDRESDNWQEFLEYACKDSAVTIEINSKIERACMNTSPDMKPEEQFRRKERSRHYKFNETLMNSLLYMEVRGIRFNKSLAKERKRQIETRIYELQHDLNIISKCGLPTMDKVQLRNLLRDQLCWKLDPSRVKAGSEEDFDICMRILVGDGTLTKADCGRLSVVMGSSINTKGEQLKNLLYVTLKLPTQRDPGTKAITADYEALQTLLKHVKDNHKSCKDSNKELSLKILPIVIEINELRTRDEHITSMSRSCNDFNDGRVHSFYNEVGSETGRVTCGKLFKKYGYPLQTVEDENELRPVGHPLREGLRDLLIADEGCYLAKCDLKGADGWTIGANLCALGDSTMLDDLKFGLKPAHFPCYERRHGPGSTQGKTREQLLEMFKEIHKSDWDYFAAKQCTWGFFYLMGLAKAAAHVSNVSEWTVSVTEGDMELFRNVLFRRYNGKLWHSASEKKLFSQPYPPMLTSPSGHTRMFFGRKQEIVGQALAHEPQSVTTYATNQAVFNCWTDPENRIKSVDGRTKLRVEPMHQVHDEFLVQFRQEDTEWAKVKIKQWFNNPIRIAGVEVTIPYDGAYGTTWAMDSKSKIGSI